ncbi:MAG: Recombination protein RecR [Candidatus Magasanikbacteria bacterium GW2011_GWC2_40_17]|uniref:Recombination protein RecR n=1 Tax=Candidatus Magasanikbacteria bacterium GW2011_GWA2_42_32 TaxID=1619039 RepID=A0A0G1D4F0_9BACT|nr:MAG: Recombination protein RecR [Candidatus Magasanikbacteria bacterium GW2011_GWC2_40_17]KKS56908.1 MAG: Recombination protein RecR [Candidatus Magasanikbacteria bacterium GW2011_GWA2_42_32]OGH85522.1 MAG: recombination protein RecR [Candidatus Magasanikbacteria bacterium RIFOXYB2_FULL_38_10]
MTNQLIKKLTEILEKFPGVGPKTAERFVFHLFRQSSQELNELAATLLDIQKNIKSCSACQNFSITDPCEICADTQRAQNVICIVSYPQDIIALEKANSFTGTYHVLHGSVNLPEASTPANLKIKELIERLKKTAHNFGLKNLEIILGLNANMEGETTALYLTKLLKPSGIKITRLARGLPQGSDLQYADEITLLNALKERKEV